MLIKKTDRKILIDKDTDSFILLLDRNNQQHYIMNDMDSDGVINFFVNLCVQCPKIVPEIQLAISIYKKNHDNKKTKARKLQKV